MLCHDIHHYLHDYVEGTLPPEKRQLVETHLKECMDCQREIPEMKNTVLLTRQLDEIDPPPFLKSRIMADVREESQRRSKFVEFFLAPVRIPVGAFALVTIILISGYLYFLIDPIGNESNALQTSQTVRPHLPNHQLSPDHPPETLVSHPDQPPEDPVINHRQPNKNINSVKRIVLQV